MKFTLGSVALFFLTLSSFLHAQCINTYPNTETFELGPVWTTGGANSDWAWGTPAKPVISSAGGGTKCWCVGGLTATFYNYSEQSYIVSPCYDFTSLTYPHVTFKIFWESEHKYDGSNLQYSINGGPWINVGAFGDPVDCMDDNWYNYSSVTYLNNPAWISPNPGWCGNIQATVGNCQGGSGSAGWVVAQHCLNGLAGQSNVKFRFTFGAGTTCNNFDGIAIDDFIIENGIPNAPDFTYTCSGINTISFTSINPPCPTPTSYQWDFGDPASGANNTSSIANPNHVFTASGTYSVSLTTSGGPCNPPGIITKTVTIMSTNLVSQTNESCFGGSNGSANANVVNGTSPFTYSWTPSGGTSQTATGLTAGDYTFTVTDMNGCIQTTTVSITQPAAITLSVTSTQTSCNASIGTASVTASGGTGGYNYVWNPSGQTSQNATGLAAGTYSVSATDAAGCVQTETVAVTSNSSINVNTSFTPSSCVMNNGTATANPTIGTAPYSYFWSNGQTTQTATGLGAGTYTVSVTDANGCSQSQTTTVTDSSTAVANATATQIIISAGESTTLIASGGGSYLWSPSTGLSCATCSNSVVTPEQTTQYCVTVTDANGCTANACVTVSVQTDCSASATGELLLPDAFSPNGDGKNDSLKIYYGNFKCIETFHLFIYNRWGQKVFETSDPNFSWDGTLHGQAENTAVFVYYLKATLVNGQKITEKGNISLIR